MQSRIDAAIAREQYGRRFATVQPACTNLRHNQARLWPPPPAPTILAFRESTPPTSVIRD